MQVCGLSDLGFTGYPFTWTNGREKEDNIQCRLDRAMTSDGFINRFTPVKVAHLPRFGSDHSAFRYPLKITPLMNKKKKPHIFRFEECWSKDENCEPLIRRYWTSNRGSCETKLAALQALDADFKHLRSNEVRKEIFKIEEASKDDCLWDGSQDGIQRYKDLERKHSDLLKKEETLWRQRSREIWLKDGDRNTKKIHGKASQRKKNKCNKKTER